MATQEQNNFLQLVAFFLAEILRSRKTSLKRAAEISEQLIKDADKLTSEDAALKWVTDLEKEFEELAGLKQVLNFSHQASDVWVYESEIKDYASALFSKDMTQSAEFLKDASSNQFNIQELCIKYPEFCTYLLEKTDKAPLLPEMQRTA